MPEKHALTMRRPSLNFGSGIGKCGRDLSATCHSLSWMSEQRTGHSLILTFDTLTSTAVESVVKYAKNKSKLYNMYVY